MKGYKTLTIKEEIYERLEKRAKKENRSTTNMAETILLEATK